MSRQRKVESICQHALALIEQEGLYGLTIGRLAQRMDWAMGALYRYFPSKDALFFELQSRVVQAYAETLSQQLTRLPQSVSPLSRVVFCAMHYVAWFRERRSDAALVAMSLAHPRQLLGDKEGVHIFQDVFASLDHVTDGLKAAECIGEVQPGSSAERTIVLWTSLLGLMQVEKLARFRPSVIQILPLVESSVAALLVGWGATAPAVEHAVRNANHYISSLRM